MYLSGCRYGCSHDQGNNTAIPTTSIINITSSTLALPTPESKKTDFTNFY